MLCVLSDCVCLGHGVDAAVFDREQYFSFGLCVGKKWNNSYANNRLKTLTLKEMASKHFEHV